MTDMPPASTIKDQKLRSEIINLVHYVQRLRQELAGAVSPNSDNRTAFETMSAQLDAIVSSTADATDTILKATETIGGSLNELRAHPEAAEVDRLADAIEAEITAVMEACSFQDLTGQRVTRIVRSMKFVEERVDAMAELWGRDEIDALSQELPAEDQTEEEALLNGPQLPGDAVSQDDIDKLFD